MPTQAKKDGNARHIAKLDIIKIQPYREEGAAIRAAAAAAGKSVQGYVLEAVREKMERERARDDGSSTGEQFPYFPDDGDTPPAAVGSSPMQSEESSPAEQISQLPPDDWAVWAHRQDNESLENWRKRLNKSHRGLSTVDVAKRLSKLSTQERDILLGADPESIRLLRERDERERQRMEEASKPEPEEDLPF